MARPERSICLARPDPRLLDDDAVTLGRRRCACVEPDAHRPLDELGSGAGLAAVEPTERDPINLAEPLLGVRLVISSALDPPTAIVLTNAASRARSDSSSGGVGPLRSATRRTPRRARSCAMSPTPGARRRPCRATSARTPSPLRSCPCRAARAARRRGPIAPRPRVRRTRHRVRRRCRPRRPRHRPSHPSRHGCGQQRIQPLGHLSAGCAGTGSQRRDEVVHRHAPPRANPRSARRVRRSGRPETPHRRRAPRRVRPPGCSRHTHEGERQRYVATDRLS